MLRVTNLVIILGLVFSTLGCLQSPLLNHARADQLHGQQSHAESEGTCPLFFSKESLCASVSWVKEPSSEEQGQFTLRFWNHDKGSESGPYVDPANTVAVKLWMPEMGHGSSPVKIDQVKDSGGTILPGIYDVQNIFFVMSGKWQIFVQLKQDKQVVDQVEFDYQF